MYLVHARLESDEHAELPAETVSLVMRCARPDEHLQHVVMHSNGPAGPVLGLFLLAPTLKEAEQVTAALCQRALDRNAELRRFRLTSCGVVVPWSYYERLLQSASTDRLLDD
ncbi:hypothetical protein ACPCBC_32655 [Streptomyces incarnatus]